MKKKILILSFFLFSMLAYSQNMTFMGLPIEGNISEFSKKLTEKGFTFVKSIDKDFWKHTGSFLGQDCSVYIVATPATLTVWKVTVRFPERTDWYFLKSEFESISQKITAKYGAESNSYNFFKTPYYEGDGYEISALKNDKCTYIKFWKIPAGSITCEIGSSVCIEISYESKSGTELKHKEEDARAAEQL